MPKALMILGTSSGAGKSTIATGLCRIFTEDGYKTVPFKAQNMSNNAHYLPDGRQMARSQAICAYACALEPDPDMNPILLKFKAAELEVVLRGHSLGTMTSRQYHEVRPRVQEAVLAAYQKVTGDCERVVLEGAGSPVEMNLKDEDIVNLHMARLVNAPVLLVADIDRGGVFASVYGTLMLLDDTERAFIKGIILNRLRGDESTFHEVAEKLEAITGVPVVGLVPYFDLKLEDEDGLTDPLTGVKSAQDPAAMELEFRGLSARLRTSLDLQKIYQIMEAGI